MILEHVCRSDFFPQGLPSRVLSRQNLNFKFYQTTRIGGATTLSLTTISTETFSILPQLRHSAQCKSFAEYHIFKKFVILSVVMFNVIVASARLLSIIMPRAVAPSKHIISRTCKGPLVLTR